MSYLGQCTAKVKGRRICTAPANTPGAAQDLCVRHYKMRRRGVPFTHETTVIEDAEQVVFRLDGHSRALVKAWAAKASLSEAAAYRKAVADLLDAAGLV